MRKMISKAVVTAVVGAVLAGLAPAAAAPSTAPADRYSRPVVKVTCQAANVRTLPKKSARLIAVVYRGEKVKVLGGLERKPPTRGFSHLKIQFRKHGKTLTGWVVFECAHLYQKY